MREAVYRFAMFVDRIKVVAKAGDGGRGCVSFRREKFVPRGGPDGGDGGKGGDVILRADEHTDNLASLFYEPLIKAKNGAHGMGKQMHGRGAPDKIVKVPVGTVVWEEAEVEDQKSEVTTSNPQLRRSRTLFCLTTSSFSVAVAVAGKEMSISRVRATARRANIPKAKRVRGELSFSNCVRLQMPHWSVIRTPGSRLSCGGSRRHIRKWRRIPLPPCIR